MPRAGLSTEAVVERAAQMLDESGGEVFSLAALAESFGVRTPSLYKHIDGVPGLRRRITIRARTSLGHTLGQAAIGRSRDDAIRRIAVAYRRWALEHPAQYPMSMHAPIAGDDEDAKAAASVADVVFNVLAGYELRGDDAIDATRFLRSALHGFVALETGGAFALPSDLERSYQRLVDSVVTVLATWPRP